MIIILDTSVVLKWLDPYEEYADKAHGLLSAHLWGTQTWGRIQKIAVPFIMFAEVLVALRKWGRPLSEIEDNLGLITAANLEIIPPEYKLLALAASLAEKARRPRRETFDSIFLAAALVRNAPFVTADEGLLEWASQIPNLKAGHLRDVGRLAAP